MLDLELDFLDLASFATLLFDAKVVGVYTIRTSFMNIYTKYHKYILYHNRNGYLNQWS